MALSVTGLTSETKNLLAKLDLLGYSERIYGGWALVGNSPQYVVHLEMHNPLDLFQLGAALANLGIEQNDLFILKHPKMLDAVVFFQTRVQKAAKELVA